MANVSYNEMIKCKTLFEYYTEKMPEDRLIDSKLAENSDLYSININQTD